MERKTREKQPLDVSLSTPRQWEIKTELQRLSEEDSNRTRLPAGGRKKTTEEPEINMRGWVISKRARHERVSRKIIRVMEKQMSASMSDSRDEELSVSAGWLNRLLHRNNFNCRRLPSRMPENSQRSWRSLGHFKSRIFERKELNTCPK